MIDPLARRKHVLDLYVRHPWAAPLFGFTVMALVGVGAIFRHKQWAIFAVVPVTIVVVVILTIGWRKPDGFIRTKYLTNIATPPTGHD